MKFIPQKSQDGDWVEFRKLGKWGEKWCERFLLGKNTKVVPLNLYTMSDESSEPRLWDDLKNYPKIPDFIAKDDNGVYLFDVKTKRKYDNSGYYFWVNKRDYQHYLKFSQILPVKIYFIFVNHKEISELTEKDIKGVFIHEVKDRKYPEQSNEKDKNIVFNVQDFKQQIL